MNAGFYGRTAPPPGAVLDRSHPLSQGLILWHAGLERSGRLAKDVATGPVGGQANRHGVLTGNTAYVPWKFGGGAWSIGTSFVNLGSTHGLPIGLNQAYSFSLWAYSNAAQGATLIDNSDGSTGVCWNITLSNANGDFVRYSYNNSQATTAAYDSTYSLTWPLRTWRHILVTDDGLNTSTSVTIYINGQIQPLGGATAATGGKKTTNQATAWGQTTTGGQNQFNGRLANIQIWNRALPAWCAQELCSQPYQQFAPPVFRRYFVPAGAGTTYTQTVSAASSASAAAVRRAGKVEVAAVAELAALVKSGAAAKSATSSVVGVALKQQGKAKSAASAASGSKTLQAGKPVSGTAGATGTSSRQAGKVESAGSSATGTTARAGSKSTSATCTTAASMPKQARKSAVAGSPALAAIATIRVFLLTISTAVVSLATTRKSASKSTAGMSPASGLLARVTGRAVSGSSVAAGSTLKSGSKTGSASSGTTAVAAKATTKPLSGSTTSSGSLLKRASRAVSAGLSGAASFLASGSVQGHNLAVSAAMSTVALIQLLWTTTRALPGRISGSAGSAAVSGKAEDAGMAGSPSSDVLGSAATSASLTGTPADNGLTGREH